MAEFTAADLTVVIPTRDRWDVLHRTLFSLAHQSVSGFETIVVVDGTDQDVPRLDADHVVVKRRAGPGAARNAGARTTERSLVMFIGDDTIPAPELVERHVAAHRRHPEREAGVLGFVEWHPEVARNRINRWLEWSGTQSWYASLAEEGEQQVSHWMLYTSNVSLKRELLVEGGGFDEDFPFAAFEDLECGLRLSRSGFGLYYEPSAICHHLHDYGWPALERRFACMALSERLMVDMHPELEARCLGGMRAAGLGRALPVERLVDVVPRRFEGLDRFVRRHADRRYRRRLAPVYLDAWDRAAELCELRRYLGDRYDSARLVYSSGPGVMANGGTQPEAGGPEDEPLFEQARRALTGRTDDALALFQRHLRSGSRLLAYGCGIGSEGLRLAQAGYCVQFADHPGPSLTYLRWRLADRGLQLPVYELGLDELPGDLDAVFCLDASGQGRGPEALLQQIEQVAPIVVLGLVAEPQGTDAKRTGPHRSVPAELLAPRSGRSRLVARHELPDGSLLLVYRPGRAEPTAPVDLMAEQRHDAPVRRGG